ncbi:3-deoxy-7-phosphoheptulonate synthase [Youngiibacter fragilis]|uniref:3-deoxy-7-phosphoheptulonate synthase n=1 Tax=Youngiibacter fragilis 232.1 TaxID=994573 RepID=V7IBJ0_9CLOT|nr:3-deoxy-7-phosphoheptulonate synthase [Youngiibacter fragilis]ETA82237.1 3-deoxy-7-phosphoheptulonate synthase [Youngiibacter fragilis 232.1]
MVLILKQGTSLEDINAMVEEFNDMGFRVGVTNGIGCSILGLIGDTKSLDIGALELMDHVEKVLRVQEPYKLANKKFHPESTIVDVEGVKIGGGHFAVIAGPCSVESESQIISVARSVKASGARMLRGGAYKPRTSPYSFQGLEVEGLDLLLKAKAETGLPIVSEIMSPKLCEIFEEKVDVIQIGARNMQNFDLLKEVGKMSRPVVLKRGLSNSYEEWVMSAEYIMAGGNSNVILCERGIRTFESFTRNTLDISAIPAIKKMSHLPIIVDPSHAGGMSWMVESLALAAIAAGADGLMIEVHNDPQHALSDGQQSLNPKQFDDFMKKSFPLVQAFHPGM